MQDREIMRNAYRLILGREPENEAVLDTEFEDVYSLRRLFMSSEEFAAKVRARTYLEDYSLIRITNFEEYDGFIAECRRREASGENYLLYAEKATLDSESFFELFGSAPPKCDPFSQKYIDWEKSFLEFLAGSQYASGNEGMDCTANMDLPPIFGFGSDYIIRQYRLFSDFLELIRPKAGERVLEMGCGFGCLAETLGRCGCKMTCLDVNTTFCEYTRKRLSDQHIDANVINASFYDIDRIQETFDIIIFDASFHHCDDPLKLLTMVNRRLKPGGRCVFMNEPINSAYDRPWGLVRYDGESIMQIRMRGWLEYGYRTDFFEQLLERAGFKAPIAYQRQCGEGVIYEGLSAT